VQRLLDREHDPGLDRVDVGREVVDEVVLGQPGEAVLVDVEMRQGGTPRCLFQQGADRLALIQPERGDVDQADDVGGVGAERGDDLAAVGVAGNQGWPVLAGQDLAQPGDVVGQPGQRELGCGDPVPVGLQVLDDGAPTGAVGPGAVTRTMLGIAVMSGLPPGLCYSVLSAPTYRITHSPGQPPELTYHTSTSTGTQVPAGGLVVAGPPLIVGW
jgi:hypothetical protein